MCQTFAHFFTLCDKNVGVDPLPPSCLSETKYEQMFFRTEPLGHQSYNPAVLHTYADYLNLEYKSQFKQSQF